MPYVFLGFLCVFVFLVCFLIDMLVKKLQKKKDDAGVVRMPKRSAAFGILLICFAICAFLFWVPAEELWLKIGCFVIAAMGAILLVQYGAFCIRYGEDGFSVREFRKPERKYTYAQIEGQRSLLTRSGVHTTLFVAGEQVTLTSAMDGAQAFLCKAFYKWCDLRGIEPDSVENNPRMMTYFPDKE